MKTNFIAKHKWWALAIVLMVALMAVSVSYSTWDTLSVKTSIKNAESGGYSESPVVGNGNIMLVDDRYLTDGSSGVNGIVDVGDIVEYGIFYQDADAVNTGKTDPQRWVVVDYNSSTKVATLLTEKVVVYGNFWGYDTYFQADYYRSTVRSWLNSGKGSLKGSGTTWKDNERYVDNVRSDGFGSTFSGTATQVNKGFLDVAFTDDEKSILIPKNITGMKFDSQTAPYSRLCVTNGTNSNTINDLIWLPSYKEIYGGNYVINGDTTIERESHFNYYAINTARSYKVSGATAYAMDATLSSYYNNGNGSANGTVVENWWWLRSPRPTYWNGALVVGSVGDYDVAHTVNPSGGVRPAVCVQL